MEHHASSARPRAGRRRLLQAGLGTALALSGLGRPALASVARQGAPRVALFVNGTLGDRSFFDSAARGLKSAGGSLGLVTRVVEAGVDPTRWEASLLDAADGDDFDLIVAGGFPMVPLVRQAATRHPGKRFVLFDAAIGDARSPDAVYPNVSSLLFRQNEGAYLAGWLGARLAGPAASLGVVGGMQVPVVEDFVVGFAAGAAAADPRIAVARQYVNSFTDPAQAKEIAKAMFAAGARVVMHAAGGSGQGVIEAAAEAGRWVIGADSDQYALIRGANPARARAVLTSVLKNVDVAVADALARHVAGTLAYGGVRSLGLAEGGVSLAEGSDGWRGLPPALLAGLRSVQQDIAAGRLKPPSAFDRVGAR